MSNTLFYGDNLAVLRNREHFPDQSSFMQCPHSMATRGVTTPTRQNSWALAPSIDHVAVEKQGGWVPGGAAPGPRAVWYNLTIHFGAAGYAAGTRAEM
jgi:hypothetical protein